MRIQEDFAGYGQLDFVDLGIVIEETSEVVESQESPRHGLVKLAGGSHAGRAFELAVRRGLKPDTMRRNPRCGLITAIGLSFSH